MDSTNNGHGQATLIERLRLYREELDQEIERHGRNATYHHEQARHYADGVVQASHGAASSISSAAHAALIEARASFDRLLGGIPDANAHAHDALIEALQEQERALTEGRQAPAADDDPLTPAEASQIAETSRRWHVRIERTITDWRAYDQHNGDQHVATTHDIYQMEQALDLCRGGTDRTGFRYRIGRRDDPESGILWFATRLDDNRNAAIVLDTLENLAIAMEMVVAYDVRVIQQRYRDRNGNCCYAEMGKTYFPTRSLVDLRTELERLQEFRVEDEGEGEGDQAAPLPPCHLSITATRVQGEPFWVVQDHHDTTPDGRPFIVFDGGHGEEGVRRCAAHLEAEALKRSEERAEDDAPF